MTEKQDSIREQIGMTREEFLEMGRIGAVFYQQGNYEKARTIFEGLVELDPESADAHNALGGVYTQIRNDDEALVHLDKAIELDPSQIAPYVNRAEVNIRKIRLEEAVVDLRKAMDLDPDEKDPGANRARAMVLGLNEAFEQATAAKEAEGIM